MLSHLFQEYTFEDDNPMMNVQNPFEEGLKKLKEGDIISAILLFEAEVNQGAVYMNFASPAN